MNECWVSNRTDTNPHGNHEVHKEGCSVMPYDKI